MINLKSLLDAKPARTNQRCEVCGVAFNTKSHKPLCAHVRWNSKFKTFVQLRKPIEPRKPNVQEQKYSLVPEWRRRPGGKKGEIT